MGRKEFIAKHQDAEAAETQTWIEFAVRSGYLDIETGRSLYASYNRVLQALVAMIRNPSPWLL